MKLNDLAAGHPHPVPGLVIRYAYLWFEEYRRGQEEGLKDWSGATIVNTAAENGKELVTVLPIAHTPPRDPALAVEKVNSKA